MNESMLAELRSKADEIANTQSESKRALKKINCDQVSWIMGTMDRLLSTSRQHFPMVSRQADATKLAALLEIMEVLGYEFEDSAAAGNALSMFWEFNAMRKLTDKVEK